MWQQINKDQGETTRAAAQTASANAFLGHLYYTAAESMPTRLPFWILLWVFFICASYESYGMEVASKPPAGVCFLDTSLRFSASSDAAFDRQDEELRQDLLKKLISRKLSGPTLEVTDSDPSRLPVRELPHGNVSCLYLMYVGWTSIAPPKSSTAACKSTFYGAWKRWSNCVRFRRRSEHAMCVVCQKLKAQIHASKDRILVAHFFD